MRVRLSLPGRIRVRWLLFGAVLSTSLVACTPGSAPRCELGVNLPFIEKLGVTEDEFNIAFSVRWQGSVRLVALTDGRFSPARTGVWVTDLDPRGAFAPVDQATILPVNEHALALSTVVQVGRKHPVSEAYAVAADSEAVAYVEGCAQATEY